MAKRIPSRLTLECALNIEAAADENSSPTFKIKAYTGSVMNVNGFYDPVVVELSGIKAANKSIPVLNGHNPDRIVGHSTDVTVSAKDVVVEGIVSGVGYYADEVVQSAAKGFPWQASIGAAIQKGIFLEEGEKTSVNGKEVEGPLIIAKRVTLNEVSFVALGADSGTSAKVAAESTHLGVCTMKFEEFVASLGLKLENLTDDQKEALQAKFDAGLSVEATAKSIARKNEKPAEKPEKKELEAAAPDPLKASRDALADDAERIASIQAMAKRDGFADVEEVPKLQASAIREGWSVDKFELECRRSARPKPQTFTKRPDAGDTKKKGAALECAVMRQCGNVDEKQLIAFYGEETLEAASDRRFQGAGIHMLLDTTIEASGRHYSGSRKSNDFIRAAFEADQMIRANEGFSTLSVSQILENVAHKQLIAGYDSVEVVWPEICALHSLSDFKPHSRYRLDSQGAFRQVPASGEIKHVSLSDDKYQKQLDTYGAILALNRQQIINDDLNAFMEIPSILGRMAAIRLEEAVFTLLLSNPDDFFHADNNNLIADPFGLAGLQAGEDVFMQQVDSNGKPILISPKKLLVPTTLKVEADNVYAETTIDTMALSSTDTVEIARNPYKGKYPPITSPYISNLAITNQDGNAIPGQSGTQWYLFADPRVRAAIAVGLLNGSRVPVLESAQTDFNTLGIQWRAYQDFGVGMEDPKAAVKSSGQ